ncbi:hypothetical protein SAMN05216284_11461 [Micromonospora sediminimaris]|nr:hypothetical protein SAMN05216284_11461 [Micromonospora sediminimaris]
MPRPALGIQPIGRVDSAGDTASLQARAPGGALCRVDCVHPVRQQETRPLPLLDKNLVNSGQQGIELNQQPAPSTRVNSGRS